MKIPAGLAAAAIVGGLMCLGTSVMQASAFVDSTVSDPKQKVIMIFGFFAILFCSQVLTRICGICISKKVSGWIVIGCLITVGFGEGYFSVGTSTVAFDGILLQSQRTQNIESPEYKMAKQQIDNYQRQIDSLSLDASNLPTNYVTARSRINDKISRLQDKQAQASAGMVKINVSTSGAAFDNMESKTGVSQSGIALVAAILLSAFPIMINLSLGALGGGGAGGAIKEKSGKKSKRQPLRAVS